MMNWIEEITRWYIDSDFDKEHCRTEPIFLPPATSTELERLEYQLNLRLSPQHREFLRQSNGLSEQLIPSNQNHDPRPHELLLPVEQIKKYTLEFRSVDFGESVNFENYLVFGDSGVDGVYFAYHITRGDCSVEVYSWDPGGRSFQIVAQNLEMLLREWSRSELDF